MLPEQQRLFHTMKPYEYTDMLRKKLYSLHHGTSQEPITNAELHGILESSFVIDKITARPISSDGDRLQMSETFRYLITQADANLDSNLKKSFPNLYDRINFLILFTDNKILISRHREWCTHSLGV